MWWVGQSTWNFQQFVFGVSFQINVLWSPQLFSSVCYQDDLSDSERNEIANLTAHNFNNNWLLYVEFSETINLCRNIWLIENWKCQFFYFWNKRCKKEENFQFFKGCFSVMHDPMDMIFGVLLETYVRLLISITSQPFLRCSKIYNNLNVKSCLKLNIP